MLKILQMDEPVLRQKAREVPVSDITKPKIQSLLKDMRDALDAEHDGVAIAAPQVGESVRIFIVSELLFKRDGGEVLDEEDGSGSRTKKANKVPKNNEKGKKNETHFVYINPVITNASRKKETMEEGCLSVRPLYGEVKRSNKVTVRAHDENGRSFERGASGLLAQIFQHEIDHLDGVLFLDKAKNVHEMPPEE